MRTFIFITCALLFVSVAHAQSPCAGPEYRDFDFWIGEWEVYGVKGKKAGDSRISLILDSCIILEEWESASQPGNFTYKGKSFNTYNKSTKQWQQTWVDNAGYTTHYVYGKYGDNKIEFSTEPFRIHKDTLAIYRLTFYRLGQDKVRQHGEQTKDNGKSWTTQYDLEYRRKTN